VESDADERAFEDVFRAQQTSQEHSPATPEIWRIIMKSPFAKLSIAAAVLVACLIAIPLWTGTESVVLADVLAKIERCQTFMYKTKTTMEDPTQGNTASESTVLVSSDYGMRVDQTTLNLDSNETTRLQMYLLPAEKAAILVHPDLKQYARMEWDEATLENARMENRDPREMLKRLLACEHRELGRSILDGRKVDGFETTDPAYLAGIAGNVRMTLWVDAGTWLPVRSETDMQVDSDTRVTGVEYDYEWGVPVDAADFEPKIPDDFTSHEMDGMKMPSYSEQGFIEALQLAVEFTGSYPERLDHDTLRDLSLTIGQALRDGDSPAAQQFRERVKNAGSKDAAMRFSMQYMMRLTSLTMFNMILAGQQKDPVYRGDVVKPSDIELPLMRWKVSDTEYRVIFGDLHTETVTAEALAALEAALPQ
jgi:outer membrane lipoprotein-sorting protein